MSTPASVAKWTEMPVLAYDVETSGVNAHQDRIVTACTVEFRPGRRPVATNWLLRPDGFEIPAEATAVHGVTTEDAIARGMDPQVALFEISATLALWLGKGFPVVAFNAAYDISITEAENTRHQLPTLAQRLAPKPVGPFIDPMVLDRKVDPYRKGNCPHCAAENKTLAGCCLHYGVPLVAAHTAESDAASAVRLFHKIVAKSPETFRGMTIGGLHMAQVGWRRDQMVSLRRYFDRNGTEPDGCDPSWPLLQAPAGVTS